MLVLSKSDEAKLLLHVLECSVQSDAWPPVLSFLDAILGCKTFLAEYDSDGHPLPPFGGELQARDFGEVLQRIETEGGHPAFQFLLNDASLYYPYCKTSFSREQPPQLNVGPEPPLGRDTAEVSPPPDEPEQEQAGLLLRAPGLITPVWRSDRSTILFGCLFTKHTVDTIDLAVAYETFRTITQALMPGLNLHLQLEKVRNDNLLLRSLLSALGRSAVLINSERDILAHTPSGLDALMHADVAIRRRQKLVFKNKQIETELQDLLAGLQLERTAAEQAGSPGKQVLNAPRSRSVCISDVDGTLKRIAIETVPAEPAQSSTSASPWFLIRVTEPAELPEDIERVLQAHYGLSQSEAHLARHLTLSGSMNDTVADLDITRNTAKTHLRRIYEKTGVHTQLQLARLVHRLAGLY